MSFIPGTEALPTIPDVEYLDAHGANREPTLLENHIEKLFGLARECVRRSFDPVSQQYLESICDSRSGKYVESVQYKIERRTNPNGMLAEIGLYGLNSVGFNFKRGAIWSDSQGQIWHYPRFDHQSRYPIAKLPILLTRVKRLSGHFI